MLQTEILDLLPEIIRGSVKPDNPLGAIVDIMEELHRPAEDILNSVDTLFDSRRAHGKMIPFLAYWLNLDWLVEHESADNSVEGTGVIIDDLGNLRELIANGAYLSQWRGTAPGLQMFISVALGIESLRIEEQSPEGTDPAPFHFNVYIDKGAKNLESVLHKIIQKEKPAYVTYSVFYE